ncbi:MAG TPA: hypothetical protein VFA12_04080 [Stellaceae bacterium]|nr:hypothetical protein [Stellaceae bacterium]
MLPDTRRVALEIAEQYEALATSLELELAWSRSLWSGPRAGRSGH